MSEKFTNILIKLGDKALLTLPGVIGAVVNFLLKSAVGFVAENLWTLIAAVGGFLYYKLKPAVVAKTSNTKDPPINPDNVITNLVSSK